MPRTMRKADEKSLILQHFSTGSYAKITYSTIWLMDVSTYACYDNTSKQGILRLF